MRTQCGTNLKKERNCKTQIQTYSTEVGGSAMAIIINLLLLW